MRQLDQSMTTTYSSDDCVLYLGSWHTATQGGRDCRCSNTQYNACLFSFRGPTVRWLGPTSNNQGFADVYIDEEFQCSLDGFSNTQHTAVVRFERRGLRTDTVHTIRIVVRKERNPSATDCFQTVESFRIRRAHKLSRHDGSHKGRRICANPKRHQAIRYAEHVVSGFASCARPSRRCQAPLGNALRDVSAKHQLPDDKLCFTSLLRS